MAAQRTGNGRANALKVGQELVLRVEESCKAPAEHVYDALADLRTHLQWAGEQQKKRSRLLSLTAPEGYASVGTEFETTGADPMGRFHDASVVTAASRPSAFEFVTEAHLELKKGGNVVDWTNVHRYETVPEGGGCRIAYTIRITRISELPGMLAMLTMPVLSKVVARAAASVARRAVRNLARLAEQRARAR